MTIAALKRVPRHAVVVASGGLDSTVLAFWLRSLGTACTLLSVDYGQRHRRRELDCAAVIAARLAAPHHVIDLSSALGGLLRGNALTDDGVDVPAGHYTDASMRVTVVPHRNALLLDLAVAVAIGGGADAVAFGAHAGDHPIYPDCRPAFVDAYREMVLVGTAGVAELDVLAPFIHASKADIVRLGAEVGVPVADTWSCYLGGLRHCGECGTCVERREAFDLAGVADPTVYERAM